MKKYIDIEENRRLENVIDRLIKADEDARTVTDRTISEQKQTEETIEERKIAVKQKYLEKAKKRIDDIKFEENEALDVAIKRLQRNFDRNTAELKAEGERQTDKWAEEIFKRVIS